MRTIRQLIAGLLGLVPSNKVSAAITAPTGTQNPPSPTHEPQEKNEQDVTALKALIAQQRGRGAKVSEDLSSD